MNLSVIPLLSLYYPQPAQRNRHPLQIRRCFATFFPYKYKITVDFYLEEFHYADLILSRHFHNSSVT